MEITQYLSLLKGEGEGVGVSSTNHIQGRSQAIGSLHEKSGHSCVILEHALADWIAKLFQILYCID